MGRRVEHHLGVVQAEQLVHLLPVPHRCDLHHKVQLAPESVEQLLLQIIDRIFRNVHRNQLSGPTFRDLTAQLRADGAAAASHQHRLALQEGPDAGLVQLDGVPAQQVLDLHLADVGGHDGARVALQLLDGVGQDMQAALGLGAQLQDLRLPLGLQGGDGQDDLGHRSVPAGWRTGH